MTPFIGTKVLVFSEDVKISQIGDTNVLPEYYIGQPPFVAFAYLRDKGWKQVAKKVILEKPAEHSRIKWTFKYVGKRKS